MQGVAVVFTAQAFGIPLDMMDYLTVIGTATLASIGTAGVPSVGLSYGDYMPDADFSLCEPIVRQVIEKVLAEGLPEGVCLNVNIPKCERILGLKRVKSASGYWKEEFEERVDPHGCVYYWLTGQYHNAEPDNPATDHYWLNRNYATVVPCRADQTAYDYL